MGSEMCIRDRQPIVAESSKPTGILTTLPLMRHVLHLGWPDIRAGQYQGPLPRTCVCGHARPKLIGRRAQGSFRTAGSECWPSGLSVAVSISICHAAATHARSVPALNSLLPQHCTQSCADFLQELLRGHTQPADGLRGRDGVRYLLVAPASTWFSDHDVSAIRHLTLDAEVLSEHTGDHQLSLIHI